MANLENSSLSTSTKGKEEHQLPSTPSKDEQKQEQPRPAKKKRNQPGMPDPEAEVVALSPKTLLATNRFVCEMCGKGFQRDQNLQLHRRGHNLPWKLKQRGPLEAIKKRVYVCPETSCVHHDPRRALGDLTGIKKHFCRKHGEKRWKCERCGKKYAVQSDWKAHLKTCGTREYKCDCGTVFSRRDSFVTHRAFCDALAQESAKVQSFDGGSRPPSSTTVVTTTATTSSAVVSPMLSINPSSEMPESAVQVTTSISSANCSTSSASCSTSSAGNHKDRDYGSNDKGNGDGNHNGNVVFHNSMFAPLLGFSPSSISQNSQSSFPGIFLQNSDQRDTYLVEPPPVLSLSPFYPFRSNVAPVLLQDHENYSGAPATRPQPTMSATALLQKAAQMGAAASGSSQFCGFGLIQSSQQDDQGVKAENDGNDVDRLPSSANFNESDCMMDDPAGYFGSKPTTLDFLGLGSSTSAAFPSYLNTIGNPLDAVATFDGGSESLSLVKVSWDGQSAQRTPSDSLL